MNPYRIVWVGFLSLQFWLCSLVAGEIHDAAKRGDWDHVKVLIARGADINAKDAINDPVLYAAVSAGNVDMIRYLISKGADIHARSSASDISSPFEYVLLTASDYNWGTVVDTLDALIEGGISANGYMADGLPYFAYAACEIQSLRIAAYLLSKGADINATNRSYCTYAACAHQHLTGSTALHIAVSQGSDRMVRFLLSQGARYDVTNSSGKTPLTLVEEITNLSLKTTLIQRMESYGAKISLVK